MFAERGQLALQFVAASARLRRELLLARAPHQDELRSSLTVELRSIFGCLRGPQALEPIGGRTLLIAGVVKERVLGRQPRFAGIKLLHSRRRAEERLQ